MGQYTKDYSSKTAEEWFSLGKWTACLMQLPLVGTTRLVCNSLVDITKLRTTASLLSAKEDFDREFFINVDKDYQTNNTIYVRASKKKQNGSEPV